MGRGGGLANGEKERMALANDGEGDEKLDGRIERRCGTDGAGCEEHGSLMILLGM